MNNPFVKVVVCTITFATAILLSFLVALPYGDVRAQSTDKATIAVVPIRLARIEQERNKVITDIATLLEKKLGEDSAFVMLSQQKIAEALKKSNLTYDDLKIKSYKDLVKALGATDVLVVIGPHPAPKKGDDAWLRTVIFRSTDMVGKSSMSLISDGQTEIDDPEFFVSEDNVKSYKATIKDLLTPDEK